MYREIAGSDERVRAIPGVRDRRVRATKVRLYIEIQQCLQCDFGLNQVKWKNNYHNDTFSFIALALTWSFGRYLNTLPWGLVFKQLPQ